MKRLVPSLLGCFLMLSPVRGLAQETSLDMYGFFTFEWEADDVPGTSSTFDLHHFNVITQFRWVTVTGCLARSNGSTVYRSKLGASARVA